MKSVLLKSALSLCLGAAALAAPAIAGGLVAAPKPDLYFSGIWLQAWGTTAVLTAIPQGKRYRVCFKVRNAGIVASGAYRVAGGGLGVPASPFADFPGVPAGGTRSGCIAYATTPSPGAYRLAVEVDAGHAVEELREDNNAAILPVTILPR